MSTSSFQAFDYLRFAKTVMGGAEHELCMSGVPDADVAVLGDSPPETNQGEGRALREEWGRLVRERWGLPEGHVLPCLGASGGVYLTIASLTTLVRDRDGGTPVVAIERPAYPAFEVSARLAGAGVRFFDRTPESGYALDPERVEAQLAAGARIVCVTNLQNPASVALAADELEALRRLAREHDAWVLLDEVYRDFLPGDVGSDYQADERIVCTSSLTKCYGLGGVRAGWIAAPPQVIDRADQIVEITHGVDLAPGFDIGFRHQGHGIGAVALSDNEPCLSDFGVSFENLGNLLRCHEHSFDLGRLVSAAFPAGQPHAGAPARAATFHYR